MELIWDLVEIQIYEYLNKGNTWLNKIVDYEWKYGDAKNTGNFNGETIYAIESQYSAKIKAKIGLMYIHDYYYAYKGGKPGNSSDARKAWIHFQKDGYNGIVSKGESLISRIGGTYMNGFGVWSVNVAGSLVGDYLYNNYNARPVFYLNPDITLKEGTTGSKNDPFILNV